MATTGTSPGKPVANGAGQEAASLVDGVYASLLAAIVDHGIAPGTQLSQSNLAARLSVSRTPVREALLLLEREGFVQRVPERGFVVATMTVDEVDEACDLLELLDTFVYIRAIERLGDNARHELLRLATVLVDSVESGDAEAWKHADRRYHWIVAESASNRFVAESLEQVRRRVQRFWFQEPLFDGRLRTCAQDHVTLAQAILDRDKELLTVSVTAHIERMRQSVIRLLASAAPLFPDTDALAAALPPSAGRGR